MTASAFTESTLDNTALAWLEGLGYAVLHLLVPPACAGHAGVQSNAAREEGGQDIAAWGWDRGGVVG